MPVILKNNAFSTLATAITASDTGIVVADGSKFPALSAGEYFYATLVSPAGTTEIIKVTARVGNSLTVVRAQDGSSAASFQVGARLDMRVNAASIAEISDEASEISIADAGGYYTATDVEGALQEAGADLRTQAAQVRDTVATLLADTVLTYTAGQVGTVTTGDIVRTRAEGFAYKVAASGATDNHITTAGGVKLYAQPTEDGSVDVAALGAVQNTDAGAIIQAALGFGLPKIAISGRYGATAISATLAAPLTIICHDAEIYRIGAGSSRVVTINTNGHDIKTEGSLTVDADNNAPEAIRFSNLLSTYVSIDLDRVVARNVYTRAADGTIGAIGISLAGAYEPIRIKTAEAHRINREAGTNVPGSNASVGLAIFASSGFVPRDVQVDNLVLDTISCDDAVGAAGNSDCDGTNINLGVSGLTGLLTDKRYSVRIGDVVARNCKGRIIKTQAGETVVNSVSYTSENIAAINGGFSLINPQAGVRVNIDNVTCKFKDNGASPFNSTYQGSIVGLYDTLDRNRPQFVANVSNINIVSDYVGSGPAVIVDASNGTTTAAGILNITNIAADAEVNQMLGLPANGGGAHRINITNAYAKLLVSGFAQANNQNDNLQLRAQNCGHLGPEVLGVFDGSTGTERAYNFSAINLTGIRSSVAGIGVGYRGAGVLRVGSIAAPEGNTANAGVLNIASMLTAAVGTPAAFRPLGARSDGTLFIMRTSVGGYAWFGLVNEAITVIYETPNVFSFGAGADPGTANRINVWVSRSTGENILWVNNRVAGASRLIDVLALG